MNDQIQRPRNRMRWPEHYGNIMRKSEISSRLMRGHKSNRLDIIDAQMAFFGLVNYSAEIELTCNYERLVA